MSTDLELARSALRVLIGSSDTTDGARVSAAKALAELEPVGPPPDAALRPEAQVVLRINPEKLAPEQADLLREILIPGIKDLATVAGETSETLERLSQAESAVLFYLTAKADGPAGLRVLREECILEPEEETELAEDFRRAYVIISNGHPACRRGRGLPDDRPLNRGKNVIPLQVQKGGKP